MVKKTTIAVQVKGYEESSIHTIGLIIGRWKELFPDEQNKLIIAEALNYCTLKDDMVITGYLVTNTKICLVLEIDTEDIKRMLAVFYDKIRKEVRLHYERMKRVEPETDERGSPQADVLFAHLFTRYHFVNNNLIRLITGREVNLSYYDPQLARLKETIQHSRFCSAIDYSGAKGPVIVKTMDNEQVK